ncbi:hypothetical protein [Nitratidesulfovibrio sp. SRB-5]|uniref:hypothetical protein n=1 Tax=Nitratidesulfovibrio sp. SRB-5 TaxID=2872636 RepID=UPI00102660A7|nr:hypothetical protein [Nitratidesulfovibrio sp. SRB-5]MBZ2172858.1 hypothetical protein [Nitratidesulfovibrio sp. SRB-5]RXF76771.1 hypothetical protein EKK70_10145 [Desulfovibrio sp. DS-1]
MIECLGNVAAAMAISAAMAAALTLGDLGAAHDPDATHDRTSVALSVTVLEAPADGNHAVAPPSGPHTRCG